jgi:hypothetical protein
MLVRDLSNILSNSLTADDWVVSLYSYFAFFYLQERKEVLASHGVEIE